MAEGLAIGNLPPLFTAEFLRDPYPVYREYLNAGGVVPMAHRENCWGVYAHADCCALLRDPAVLSGRAEAATALFSAEEIAELSDMTQLMSQMILFIDGAKHARMRRLMNKSFSTLAVGRLRLHIEAIVEELLEPLENSPEIDIQREIAYPLPVRVIASMLGVPSTEHGEFIAWSDAFAVFLGNPQRTVEQARAAQLALRHMVDYFRDVIAVRRRQGSTVLHGDLVSALIDVRDLNDALTDDEIYAQCILLLFAGHETTRNLISNGMYTLMRHPAALADLRDDPSLMRTAIEECLRFEAPIQYTVRIFKEPLEIRSQRIPERNLVFVMVGAANRDPREFEEPETFNIRRAKNAHLTFGGGPHFCIGHQLARMEAEAAMGRLIQQFPTLRPAPGAPQWAPNFGFRGLRTLPVQV